MKIGLVSLGCSKNLVDSENILGWFKSNDHVVVSDLNQADILVVNTCGFIEPAKKESIDTLLDLSKYKDKNAKALIATGCLVQRYYDELKDALPEVDAFIRIQDYPHLSDLLDPLLGKKSKVVYGKHERLVSTLKHSAYLKIAEGCSNRCSYCAIPLIRGNMDSYSIDSLVLQAQKLADDGVKEVVLIAQDTSRYGEEKGSNQLVELLKRIQVIEGIKWIRLLYLYPNAMTDTLLKGMKECDKVVPYFDIPIQHADDNLLKNMFRKGLSSDNADAIKRIRNLFPQAVLRTTVIVGFPGETEEQFQTLLNFIEENQFDRLGAFTYSPEDDTAAFELVDDVTQTIKEDRLHRLMQVQAHISERKMTDLIGKTFEVLIEARQPKQNLYHGRTYGMAPDDVDGELIFTSEKLLKIGDFVDVLIDEVSGFDLMGHAV